MDVFNHHIYEYKKGLRRMVLYTTESNMASKIENKLETCGISYYISYPGKKNINVFFGDLECISVLKEFQPKSLTDFTLEEDFILGAMLGYDIRLQCQRYLKRQDHNNQN